ncbi:Glucan 1,3-beta-glucosidase, partial [Globisporangium splendens]
MQRSPREVAVQRFEGHWKSFITEDDIAQIASAGLNTVRVPVGYWITGFDDHDVSNEAEWKVHAPGGLKHLDRLVREWVKTHNVSVLISMHAAKGSQNGAENSSPAAKDRSLWPLYPGNIATTVDAVRFLAQRYKGDDAFLGIGLLNEPDGATTAKALYQYYEDAYRLIRIEDQNDCILTVSPLLTEQSAKFDLNELLPGASNVWVEWHRYSTRGFEDATEDELLTSAIPALQSELDSWKDKSDKKLFIGEFSFAIAKQQFTDTQHRLNEFAHAQLELLTNHVDVGWTFWTWRVSGDDDDTTGSELSRWSLRSTIRNGVFSALT